MAVVRELIGQGVAESDIAVLSQYRAQYKELQTALQQRGYNDVAVCTVAAAQGTGYNLSCCRSATVMFFSTTVSNAKIFL